MCCVLLQGPSICLEAKILSVLPVLAKDPRCAVVIVDGANVSRPLNTDVPQSHPAGARRHRVGRLINSSNLSWHLELYYSFTAKGLIFLLKIIDSYM